MDPEVLGTLPSTEWAGFHGPEPVTLSLRPSVLLRTHGEEGQPQMLIVSVSQGPCEVTALLSDRDRTGEFSCDDPMGSVTQGGAAESLGRARVSAPPQFMTCSFSLSLIPSLRWSPFLPLAP